MNCEYCGNAIPAEIIKAAELRKTVAHFCGSEHRSLVHRIKAALSLIKRESAFIERLGK